MCGTTVELSQNAFAHLPSKEAEACKDACACVLDSQFVHSAKLSKTFKVMKGAGMGLQFAGDLANKLFYDLGEADFAAKKDVQQEHGF